MVVRLGSDQANRCTQGSLSVHVYSVLGHKGLAGKGQVWEHTGFITYIVPPLPPALSVSHSLPQPDCRVLSTGSDISGFPEVLEHSVFGPQGRWVTWIRFFSTLVVWQMFPALQSRSTSHSRLHPDIVSGMGYTQVNRRQIGFPLLLSMHFVFGPQGEGLQGSGLSVHW